LSGSTHALQGLCLLVSGLALFATACTTFSGIPDLVDDGVGGAGAQDQGATAGDSPATGAASGAGGRPGATTGSSNSGAGSGASAGAGGAASASSSAGASTSAGSGAGASSGSGPVNDTAQLCVDTINQYRATLGLPPYQRWADKEVCASDEATKDAASNMAHGAFGQCGELAQNECPNWPAPAESMITSCLEQMWAEGPGSDFPTHGHYINMSSTKYTKVACGFTAVKNGKLWAVQDFQ
jgi:hypothetical protein